MDRGGHPQIGIDPSLRYIAEMVGFFHAHLRRNVDMKGDLSMETVPVYMEMMGRNIPAENIRRDVLRWDAYLEMGTLLYSAVLMKRKSFLNML